MAIAEIMGERDADDPNENRRGSQDAGLPREDSASIVHKVAAAVQASSVPEISEGYVLYIPLGGTAWKRIAEETGLGSTMQMKKKLGEIARDEGWEISIEYDDEGARDRIRLFRKKGVTRPLNPANLAFIRLFLT
jgi:hypothetical protein